jgi:tetratricopeptide repeat protein/WD40 repeat protein
MVDSPADTLRHTNLLSISRTGNIYLGDRIPPAAPDVFVMRKDGQQYGDPVSLKGQVNTRRPELDGWIDPEERFVLLTAVGGPDAQGGCDLYISLRQPDNTWGPKLNLGERINSTEFERFASLTPDYKTLHFVRAAGSNFPGEDHSYYRVSAESVFTQLGYNLIHSCDSETAVEVFNLATELYPDSWNTWDSLADAYKNAGDREQAVRCYEKALEINPENPSSGWGLRLMDRAMLDLDGSTDAVLTYEPGQQTELNGPYLGQSLPGTEPELFAPGLASICGRVEYNPVFTPDGKELYFSTSGGLMVSRLNDQGWTAPQPAEFSGFEPFIAGDGQRLFLGRGAEIWLMDRVESGWGNDRKICDGMRPYADSTGNLYVTDISREDHVPLLQILRPDGDAFHSPEYLPEWINQPAGAAHPCISADGNTLIFDSFRTDEIQTNDYGDFFICRRTDDGDWSRPRRLPATINTPGENICGTFSPDEKFFFYTAYDDIWWVDARALEF